MSINEEAFARDVVLLVVNSGLTWKGVEDMMNVINAHCRGKVVTKNLPATKYQLKRITSCVRGAAKLYHTCPKCDFVFKDGQGVCTCGIPPMLRVKRQLLVNDVPARIKRMFANPMLARAFGYAATRVPGDGDVWDGAIMRDIPTGNHRPRTHKHNAHTHTSLCSWYKKSPKLVYQNASWYTKMPGLTYFCSIDVMVHHRDAPQCAVPLCVH